MICTTKPSIGDYGYMTSSAGEMMSARVLLVEYFVTDDGTVLFIGRHDLDSPVTLTVPLPRAKLRELSTRYFSHPGSGDVLRREDPTVWQTPLAPLVAPLADWSAPGDLIWFVPHDVLHRIPLHALLLDGEEVIARSPVVYSPSASVMRYCQGKRRSERRGGLVLSDSRPDRPLAHAREQAVTVGLAFPSTEVQIHFGTDATVDTLTAGLASRPEGLAVLHLACHGQFDASDPMRAALLLAPRSGDNSPEGGRVTARDLMGMHLPVNLVTVSACESGVTSRLVGDELVGLTRALLYAGASSVVVSLWAVDEVSTSMLMRRFYDEYMQGVSAAISLQRAQHAVRNLTLRRILEHCLTLYETDAKDATSGVATTIDLDIADIRFLAHDFQTAEAEYTRLARELPAEDPDYLTAVQGAARCRAARRSSVTRPIDYTRKPYLSPFYWAPFVLVGDWR